MATTLNGNPANVTTPLPAVITALANNGSGAIRVTTLAAHLFGPGDTVKIITGVLVASYPITIIDATHFDLVGSAFTATSTGIATDLSLTPQVKLPTDGDTFSMQLSGMLSGLQACLDRDQYLNQQIIAATANVVQTVQGSLWQNWTDEFNTNGSLAYASSAIEGGAFDPFLQQWITVQANASGSAAAHVFVTAGLDQGASAAWTQVGTGITLSANAFFAAVCSSATNVGHYLMAEVDNSGPPNAVSIYLWNASSWALKSSITSTTAFYGCTFTKLGAYVILAVAGSASGDPRIISSNNEWTSTSTYSPGVSMPVGSGWLLKSNGSQAVAIPSASGLYTVYTSPDGHTWTSNNGLASILASGNTVVGLAWITDAIGPCWLAAVQSGSGQPFWCRSSDGVNWSTQSGGVSTNMTVTSMAGIESFLCCTLADATSGGLSGQIFSQNGGVTWYLSQATLTSSQAGGNGYITPHVIEGYTGFFAFNNLNARLSLLAGLPGAKL